MYKIKKLLITTLIITCFCITKTYAEEVKISEILGEETKTTEETTTNTETTTTATNYNEEDALNLNIPEETDNPSFIVTFTDPSKNGVGIQLEIDGKSYTTISSPYSLPALSIGKHTLKFKFTDSLDATQVVEKTLVIIPRAPIISAPKLVDDKVVVSGTGLSNSTLILMVSSNSKIITASTTVDSEGSWTITINEKISDGVHSFTAYVRKYGYASNLAEVVTANLINDTSTITPINSNTSNTKDIYFSFDYITTDNIKSIITSNKDLDILLIATLVIGVIIATIFSSIFRNSKEKKEIQKVENIIKPQGENNSNNMTLFEKLSKEKEIKEDNKENKKEEKKEETKKVEETSKKEEKKTIEESKKDLEEKIITRIDFLKDFKRFDPDDDKGKEIEDNKNIKVSLTSKS